jgi:hypothetical protein
MTSCAMKHNFVWVLCLFVLTFSCAPLSAENFDTEGILEAFRNSFNWLDNCSFSASAVSWNEHDPDVLWKEELAIHNDSGDRQRLVQKTSVVNAETDKLTHDANGPRAYYRDGLFTPETQGFFLRGEGQNAGIDSLLIYEAGAQRYQGFVEKLVTREFAGFFYGNERSLQELLTSETVKNIEKVDLDGQSSYRIEAELEAGSLTLWLAPEMGYAAQKWQLVSYYDTHMAGYEVSEISDPGQGVVRAERDVLECTFSEHQNIQGHFIPMKVERRLRAEAGDTQKIMKEKTVQLTRVELSPDFDASNAFELPDYSKVRYTNFTRKDNTSISGFKWEDGKLVADVDAHALDNNIRTALEQIKTGKPTVYKNNGDINFRMDGLDGASGFLFRHGRLLAWISGALFLLACGAVGIFAYKNRKGKTNLTEVDAPTDEESSHASEGLEAHE